MGEKKYSEKEIAILEGMIRLIKSGTNPYLVKVSDIAQSAGVGKGTIYDYFQTKEEVILKAMLLNIHNEIHVLTKRMDSKEGFKEKYYELLKVMAENLNNKFSAINVLVSTSKLPEFQESSISDPNHCDQHHRKMEAMADQLLETGYREGIIQNIKTKQYQRMVMSSALIAFGNYLTMKKTYAGVSIQEAMDYSYTILIKSLNQSS